jgi:hypothetical protein
MDFFVLQDAERSERFLTTSRGLESVAAARHPSRSPYSVRPTGGVSTIVQINWKQRS